MTKVQIEITLGVLLIFATSIILIVVGLNEEPRMAQFEIEQQAAAIEAGAELFDTNCRGCHGPQGEGIPGLAPPLNDRYFFDSRVADVGWGGTQEDYVVSTISTGRLVSTRPEYVGGGKPAMPAWSDHYGGPLRDDQIRSIATFIMNWEPTAGQVYQAPEGAGEPFGTDITMELPEGDVDNGRALADSQGCTGCHVNTATGPAWAAAAGEPGIGPRAQTRIEQADYTGAAENAHQYLLEAIVQPGVYVVPNFQPIMPANYGETLSAQQLADLIAYMLTIE